MNTPLNYPTVRPPVNSGRHRIILVACYFGKLPPFAPLVFRSIGENRGIDWIFVADQEPDFPLPPNITLHIRSLESIAHHCADICGFPIQIEHPYHICSLRPAFGLLFEEEFRGYDFWGHVDLDVIFGDVLGFLPDDVFDNHDRVLCRGHLSMYRNSEEVNNAFMLPSPGGMDYKVVFRNLASRPFLDEWRGIWKIMRYHRFRQYHDEFIADIKKPTQKKIGRFEAYGLSNYPHQFFYWHQGKTFQAYYQNEGGLFDREVAYIHFQKRLLPAPTFPFDSVPGFSIGPEGFAPYDRENLFPAEMDKLNLDLPKSIIQVHRERVARYRKKWEKLMGIMRPS